MASVRIVTADHYMSTPIEGLDPVYSESRGSAVTQVPVIRIFGTTKNGIKTCLHVHGVLPYLFIPFAGNADLSVLPYQLASSLDKALNILQGLKNSNAQHVYKITPVSGKPIYGFHRKEHLYLKVFFYNWAMRDKAVALLQNGAVCNQAFQPHEAHVPYILQFFIDYNLYGMSFIEFSSVKYRFSEDNSDYLADINEDLLLKKVACSSFSKLEIDGKAADILNYKNITGTNLHNPGIASLWEEERRRRNAEDKSDIAPPSSQERICKQVDRAEAMYKNKLRQKLQKLGFDKKEPSLTSLSANYPAETPCNADLLSASYLEPVVCSQSKNSSTIGTNVSPEETIVDEDIVFHLTQQNASDLISNSFHIINTQDAVVLETLESLARDQETGESSHLNVSYSQPVAGKPQDVELISMKVDDDSILGTQTIGCIQANDLNEDIHEDLSNVFNNAAVEEISPPRDSPTDISQEGVLEPPHEKIHSLTQVAQKIYDTEDSSVPSENQSFQCENSMSRDGSQKTVSSGNIPQVDGAHDSLDIVSPSEKVLVKKHQQDVLKECKDAFNRYVFSPENSYNSVCSPFRTSGSSSKLGCLSSNKKRMPKRSKPKRRRSKSLPRKILKNLSSESEDCGNDDSTSVCSSSTTELQSHNHVTHVIPRSVIMDIIGVSEPTASISENPESSEDCAVVVEPFESIMDVNDDRPDGWFFESFEDFYKSEGGSDCSRVSSNPQKKYPHWPKNERNCDHTEAFNQANTTLQCFVNLSLNNSCQENSAGFQTIQSRKELKPVSEIFTPMNFSRDVVKDSFSATLSPSFEAPNLETENFPQIIPNNEVKVIVTADVHCVGSKPARTSSRRKGENVPSRLKKFQAEFLGALSSTSKDAELYEITAAPLEPNKSPACKTVIPLMRKKPRKRKNVFREKKKKKKKTNIHLNRRNLVSTKCFDVVLPHSLLEKTPWVRDPNSRSCEKMLHKISPCTEEKESFSPTALEESLNSNKGLRSSSINEKSGTSLSTASNILQPEGDETRVFSLKDVSGNSLSKTSGFLLQEKNIDEKTTLNFIPLEGESAQPEQFKLPTQNPSLTVENEMQQSFAEAQVETYGLRKCSVRLERLPSQLSAENYKCNSEVCLSKQEFFSKTLCPLKTLDLKSVNLPESISNVRMLVSQKVMERSLNFELKTSQTENTAEEKGKIESSNHSKAWNNEESSTKAISNPNISPLSFSADLNESNVTPKILINKRIQLQSVQHPSPMKASEFEISFSNFRVDGDLNLVNSNESDQSHALSNFTKTAQLSLTEENFSILKNIQVSESGAVNSVSRSKPGRMKARLKDSTLLDQEPIEKQVSELSLCKTPNPKLSPLSLSQLFSPCTVQKVDCSNHLVQNKTTRDETYCYKRYKKNQSYLRSETNALGGVAFKSKRLCAIDALKKIKDLRIKIKEMPPDGKSVHCKTNLETQNMNLPPVIKSLTKGRLSSSVGCQTDESNPPVWDGPKSLVPYHDVSNIDLLQRTTGTNSNTRFFDQILHSFHRNWYLELQEFSDSRIIHSPSFSLSNTSDSSDVKAIMTFRQCNLLPGLTDGTARVFPVDAEDMTSCSKSILGKRKQENKENYGADVQYGNNNNVVAVKKALVALGNCRVIVERLPCDMSCKTDYGVRCVSNGWGSTPDSSKKVLSQCFHLQKSFSNGSSLYHWALDGTIDLSSDTSDEDLKQNSLKSIQNALENNSQSSNCSDLSDCLSSEKSSPERKIKLRRSKFPKCSVLLKPIQVDRPPALGAKPIVRSICSNNSQSSNEVIVGELPSSSSGNKRRKNQERYQKIITKKQVVTNMSGPDEKLTKLQPVVKIFKLDFQKIKNGISASHADYFLPVVGGSPLTSSQKIRRRRPTYPDKSFTSGVHPTSSVSNQLKNTNQMSLSKPSKSVNPGHSLKSTKKSLEQVNHSLCERESMETPDSKVQKADDFLSMPHPSTYNQTKTGAAKQNVDFFFQASSSEKEVNFTKGRSQSNSFTDVRKKDLIAFSNKSQFFYFNESSIHVSSPSAPNQSEALINATDSDLDSDSDSVFKIKKIKKRRKRLGISLVKKNLLPDKLTRKRPSTVIQSSDSDSSIVTKTLSGDSSPREDDNEILQTNNEEVNDEDFILPLLSVHDSSNKATSQFSGKSVAVENYEKDILEKPNKIPEVVQPFHSDSKSMISLFSDHASSDENEGIQSFYNTTMFQNLNFVDSRETKREGEKIFFRNSGLLKKTDEYHHKSPGNLKTREGTEKNEDEKSIERLDFTTASQGCEKLNDLAMMDAQRVTDENNVKESDEKLHSDNNATMFKSSICEGKNDSSGEMFKASQPPPSLVLKKEDQLKESVMMAPAKKPPTNNEILNDLSEYGIPLVENPIPFYSNAKDSTGCKEIGGTVLKVKSKSVKDLGDFSSPFLTITNWHGLLSKNFLIMSKKPMKSCENMLMSERRVRIAPVKTSPTFGEAAYWLKAKTLLQKTVGEKEITTNESDKVGNFRSKKEDAGSNKQGDKTSNKSSHLSSYHLKEDIEVSCTLVEQSSHCSADSVLSGSSSTSMFKIHLTPVSKAASPEEENAPEKSCGPSLWLTLQEKFSKGTNDAIQAEYPFVTGSKTEEIPSETINDTHAASEHESYLASEHVVEEQIPAVSEGMKSQKQCKHVANVKSDTSSKVLSSADTDNSPLASDKSEILSSRSDQMPPEDDADSDNSKLSEISSVNNTRTPMMSSNVSLHQKLLNTQFRKELQTPVHQASTSCCIDGPSPSNSGNFKRDLDNYQQVKTVIEFNYLTIMVMELHASTREDLRPDPDFDPIEAVFYSIINNVPPDTEKTEETGVIAVSKGVQQSSSFSEFNCSCIFVEDEKSLIQRIVELVRSSDPDILIGYEIELLSWTYLIQRAYILNINLLTELSRVRYFDRKKLPSETSLLNLTMAEEKEPEIRLTGRIVINLWRLLRSEVALQSYSFENIMYHILHQRVALHSFKSLTLWWNHPSGHYRWLTVEFYLIRVKGIVKILDQLDLVGRTAELARLFGILFYEVLSRGSQFRVESMMLRLAKPRNFVAVSPSQQQRARMRAPESLPLILEPESRFYHDPVIVLDFQSLYPSIIIAYNYCFSTCLGRVDHLGENEIFEFGCTQLRVPFKDLIELEDKITIAPCGSAFVRRDVRKGLLPAMLEEILETRLMVKQSMKLHKTNKGLQRVLHSRQLGLKLIANVTYGYTAANFSGRMPSIEVGDAVVSKGRETLGKTIELVNTTEKWGSRVIYGDTDSLFVLVPGRSREDAFKIGAEIAEAVTNANPTPVKLKLEKVYQPCILQTKKRYVGYMYESPDQEKPTYDAKGIETVRRDGCPAVAKILEKCLRLLFETTDISHVKRFVCKQFSKILTGRISIQDVTFAREYRGAIGYKPGACVPALQLAQQRLLVDPRSEPRVCERVPYVVVAGPPGLPIIRLVRSPYELLADPSLKINAEYYITRVIIPPLDRCFSLLGVDIFKWYHDLPRRAHTYLPSCVSNANKKATISQYFVTTNCVVCNQQTHAGICVSCQPQSQMLAVTLCTKMSMWERKYDSCIKVCQSCCGRLHSYDCISLDCPVLYRTAQTNRDRGQIPFLRQLQENYLNF